MATFGNRFMGSASCKSNDAVCLQIFQLGSDNVQPFRRLHVLIRQTLNSSSCRVTVHLRQGLKE